MEVLVKATLAFPSVFEAKSVMGAEPKFSATLIFAPDSESHKNVQGAIDDVAKEKWTKTASATLASLDKAGKTCLRSGDEKPYDGFAGQMYVSASSKVRPTVLDRDRSPLTESDGRIYGGCVVNALIDVWAQDNQYGKRINATLKGIQFVRDGEAFSSGAKAALPAAFPDLGMEEEDADAEGLL